MRTIPASFINGRLVALIIFLILDAAIAGMMEIVGMMRMLHSSPPMLL